MAPPRIFYFCFDNPQPMGGNKQIYRHVDILNRHGLPAWVVHGTEGFRLAWFDNETPVMSLERFGATFDEERDWLVVPEDLGAATGGMPGRNKVIFNQSFHYGFRTLGRDTPESYPPLHPDVRAMLTVSEHSRALLKFTYPGTPVLRVRNGIDPDRYRFRPAREKRRQVVCVPGKNGLDVLSVRHMVQSRAAQGLNVLGDFTWRFVDRWTEAEVAQALQESALFLSLSLQEGFSLMPLEALACGCLVVAYGIPTVREYLPEAYQVEPLDLRGAVERLESLARALPADLAPWEPALEAGRSAVQAFSMERETQSVRDAWARLLDGAAGA